MRKTLMISPLLLAVALSACQSGDKPAAPAATADSAATAAAAAAPAQPATPGDPKQTAERAFAALRKSVPDFERLGYSHLVGDLDGDGIDDVAIVYGEGTPDATMAAMTRLAVAMSRGDQAQLLPQRDLPDTCVSLRKIEGGRLYLETPDICTAARPKIAEYSTYAWNGKTLARVEHQTREERIMSGLRTYARAFAGKDKAGILNALKFPFDAGSVQISDTALEQAAQRNGGKIDRAMAERHFDDLLPPDRVADYALILSQVSGLTPVQGKEGTFDAGTKRKKGDLDEWFTLTINPDPDEDRFDGNEEMLDSRIDLEGGTGKDIDLGSDSLGQVLKREDASTMYQGMRFFLIDGELRLVIPNAAG